MQKIKASASAGALGLSLIWCAAVNAQSVAVFEQVAGDASIGANETIPNNWGGHQPRITRHNDDTVRLLYLKTENGVLKWQVRRRPSGGGWVDDTSATASYDDATLLRNPKNDNAYVLAWPASKPTLYNITSGAAPTAITGSWPNIIAKYRQYQNTGIAEDGTLCLKVAFEPSTNPPTSAINTQYSCASFDLGTQTYTWPGITSHYIGARYVYDYLHVNPALRPLGLYGTSKRDVHRDASNVPSSNDLYVKNGLRTYFTESAGDTNWNQYDFVKEMYAPPGATIPPSAALQDALIDSKGRLFATYALTNPVSQTAQGIFTYVTDFQGNTIHQGPWTGAALVSYGSTRIYEDANQHLWLLWANQGNRSPEVKIYPINETSNPTSFSLGTPVDLSAAFHEAVPDGTRGFIFYLANTRGGNERKLYIDAIFNACSSIQYSTDHQTSIDKSQCYADGKQKVYYVRIDLPN